MGYGTQVIVKAYGFHVFNGRRNHTEYIKGFCMVVLVAIPEKNLLQKEKAWTSLGTSNCKTKSETSM